jgi:thiopeptide-type bacteriocin biosynthesis protein
MAQNPGIIFAEIAYVANDHVDNINRRQHIWPFEIPVLTHSTLDAKDQIPLDDLWLTVDQDDRVILISKKHQKQVVPRLSSAYNFMNSDLAAFRFLCDLQYPDDRSDFSFNFQQLFPGLDYYPRVQIESVIISLATWELSANNFDPILKKEKSLWYDAFKMLAENIALCNQFTLAKNDQELMFELQNEDSILFFLSSIQKMDKITLKEFISEAPDKALVTDRAGKAYINQFIAALHNGECDHQPSKTYKLPEKWAQKNFIGSEWIYIKLYCHEDRSDYLLHKYIYPALKRLGRLNNNLKWFYVRYYDPEHHIRLRIKTSEWHIFESFKKALTVPINDGFISALNTELYKKELIRYSERLMPYVEQFFCADSALTLHFINKQFTNQTQLKTTDFALLTTIAIIKFFKNDEISSVDFCNVVFNGLLTEYSNPKQIKIDLDQKFRLMKGEIETLFTTSQLMKHLHADKLFKTFNDQLDILKKKAEPANVDSLLSDLVHMHLNRIFNSEQRSQEMVVYFLLYKYQKSVYARKKSLL